MFGLSRPMKPVLRNGTKHLAVVILMRAILSSKPLMVDISSQDIQSLTGMVVRIFG